MTGGRGNLRNEEHNSVSVALNIIWVIKLRRLTLEGHAARKEEMRYTKHYAENPESAGPHGKSRSRCRSTVSCPILLGPDVFRNSDFFGF